MVSMLMLSMALGLGQVDGAAESIALETAPIQAPVTASDRWFLMNSLQGTYPGWLLDGNRLQVSGWTNPSFTASSAANDNLPLGLNYRANEALLQQNWLRLERAVRKSGTAEPTIGFRTDFILPGSDYRFTLPRGIFNGQLTANNGGPNNYGVDPIQFYGEAYLPTIGEGLQLKVGRMYCQFGAEATDAPANALVSHSYTFFYDPFTQTGALATIQCSPEWSYQFGVMLGPDVFIDPADSPYGVFSVKWAPPDGPDSLLFSMFMGSGRYDAAEQFNNPNVFDIVYTHRINPVLSYTLDALYGYQLGVPDIGTANWFGLVNYLSCKLGPRLTGTTRFEIFNDIDGNRTGYAGVYTAATAGLNFLPRPSTMIRPEIRFDYNNESRPFEDKHGLLTASIDIVQRW